MRLRALLCVLVFSFISLLIVFSGVSIKASAVTLPSGGHYMSVSDTRAFLGDHIPATYWNGSQYIDITFDYMVSFSVPASGGYSLIEHSESPCNYMTLQDTPYLCYYAALTSVNANPDYVTVHLQPQYSIFGTDWLYTGFGLSTGSSSTPSSATYDSPQCNWYLGGTVHNFYNSNDSTSSSGQLAYLRGGTSLASNNFTYIPVYTTSATSFSAYCQDASFYGNSRSGNTWGYYFLVMCPYVSGNAAGGSGTFTSVSTVTTSSGGSDVDLTETNGLLGSIISGIAGIGDSIKGLFVPDEEDLVDFKEDVADILTDSFSGYSETQDLLDDVRDVLISSNPSAVLEFPALSIPGTSFSTPAKSINLNFDNTTIEWVKWIIDIMATIAVVNMIQNKIKAVLVGESVVEVEEIDG